MKIDLLRRMRRKAHFFLNNSVNKSHRDPYSFTIQESASHVEHLDYFEVDPTKMVGILPSMKEKTTFKRD